MTSRASRRFEVEGIDHKGKVGWSAGYVDLEVLESDLKEALTFGGIVKVIIREVKT